MNDSGYPQIELDSEQKDRHAKILIDGNTALLDVYNRVEDKSHDHTSSRMRFRDHILNVANGRPEAVSIDGLEVIADDVTKIQAVKNLESELVTGYAAMIYKVANKWGRKHTRGVLDVDDLTQEGMMALLKAIVYYLGKAKDGKVCFSTYLWHAVYRRLLVSCMRDRLVPTAPESGKLLVRFDKAKSQINGPANFDEIVKIMDLTEIEMHQLIATQTVLRVQNKSQNKDKDAKEWVEEAQAFVGINDDGYVTRGRRNGLPVVVLEDSDNGVDSAFVQALAIVEGELDDWQTAVLQAFVVGEHGWREKVSSQYTNPVTEKRYSRAAPNLALVSIFNRVREEYGELKHFRLFEAI